MITNFLQFGYIGLIALLITLCYRILQSERDRHTSLPHALIITGVFSVISIAGGAMGYFWASKELEVAKTQQNALSIKNSQIESARSRYENSTSAIGEALEASFKSLNDSVLDSTRETKLSEIERINGILSAREADYHNELNAIAKTFSND